MSKKLKIPKSCEILGHRIKIVTNCEDFLEEINAYGAWVENELTIYLDTRGAESFVWYTLWHELVHAILDLTGHKELSQDERFVDALGGVIYQVVKTLR